MNGHVPLLERLPTDCRPCGKTVRPYTRTSEVTREGASKEACAPSLGSPHSNAALKNLAVRLTQETRISCSGELTTSIDVSPALVRDPAVTYGQTRDRFISSDMPALFDQMGCGPRLAALTDPSQCDRGRGKEKRLAELAASWWQLGVRAVATLGG